MYYAYIKLLTKNVAKISMKKRHKPINTINR